MDLAERDPVVTIERDDVFFASPIFTVAFGWYVEAGTSVLAPGTLPFPCVCAVAAVNVRAQLAFQYPNTRVVIIPRLVGLAQQPLFVLICVARYLQCSLCVSRSDFRTARC